MSDENIVKLERQLIYLFLHDKNLIEEWLDSNLKKEYFHEEHHAILNAIINSYDQNVLLTRQSFNEFIKNIRIPKDRIEQEIIFNKCYANKISENNFPLLVTKILDNYLLRITTENIKKFNINREKRNNTYALKELVNNLQDLVGDSVTKNVLYENIKNVGLDFRKYFDGIRSGEIIEDELVLCGIREIDNTMVTGYAKGTLTLFCADVSAFKSTMMLNIGLNVWKKGHNVLFVPLEMESSQMYKRALARESHVSIEKLFHPKDVNAEEVNKINEAEKKWDNYDSKFYILELPDRTKVSSIKRQIEKNIDIFYPKLVIIDYIANLVPDKKRVDRNDLEIGDMLKDLRHMGKTMGFAVVSAAQLGREALKRIRKHGSNKNKTSINSEDIQGSHAYSADADNIYAQLINSSQPDSLLDIYVVKARNGKKTFPGGNIKASLDISPEIGLIKSQDDFTSPEEGLLASILEKTEETTPTNDMGNSDLFGDVLEDIDDDSINEMF